MRGILRLAAFALVPVMAPASAQDAAQPAPTNAAQKLALARQIVELGYPKDAREAIFFGTMDQMTAQMKASMLRSAPIRDAGAEAIMDEWLTQYTLGSKGILRRHIPLLIEAMAQSYGEMFSVEELTDILAFVSTPSGQRFFMLSPAVISAPSFSQANQAYMDEIAGTLPAAQAELRERLAEYFRQRAERNESNSS